MPQLRFTYLLCFAVLAAFLAASAAQAHHGWAWATDEEFEITGVIQSARLGNPRCHGGNGVLRQGLPSVHGRWSLIGLS